MLTVKRCPVNTGYTGQCQPFTIYQADTAQRLSHPQEERHKGDLWEIMGKIRVEIENKKENVSSDEQEHK